MRPRPSAWAVLPATLVALVAGAALPPSPSQRDEGPRPLGEPELASLDGAELPFVLDRAALVWAEATVPATGSRRARMARLLDTMADLRLEYVRSPTRDASAVLRSRQANCLSFVHLFVALARRLGIDAVYVEVLDHERWDAEGGSVVSRGHVVAGVAVDGELRTYDFLPYRPAEYRRIRSIDDRRALAHHFNNLGAEALIAGATAEAAAPLRRAIEVDPSFFEALNNLGVLELRRGRPAEAAALLRRGLELSPDDVALLGNLARLEQRLGHAAEADALLSHLARLRHENPFFHLYLGDAALERNDPQGALESMRQALSLDPDLPESHLGMARAYFALGELERTRHHLVRARRLDPLHPELARWEALVGLGAEPPP